MKKVIFYLLLCGMALGCKPQKHSVENLPERQLIFGNGGGITGVTNTYLLLENGQLFHMNSLTKKIEELPSLHEKEARRCFERLDGLSLAEMNFDHPGNVYYFLEEVDGDTKNRVVWGSTDHQAPRSCTDFYKELGSHIK